VQIANYPPNLKYNNHMGKLHSLKRAIQRDPDDFFQRVHNSDEVVPAKARKYNNKHFKKTHFQVWRGDKSWSLSRGSYYNFVKKVLIELGYKVYMRR
jgi:hypothetical protein